EGTDTEGTGAVPVAGEPPEGRPEATDAGGGLLLGVRRAGEGAVRGPHRVRQPPAVPDAARRGGGGVRVRRRRAARAPLRRRALPEGAVGGGAGHGGAALASVQLRQSPRRRLPPAEPGTAADSRARLDDRTCMAVLYVRTRCVCFPRVCNHLKRVSSPLRF
ncbi:Auxin responsive protein, partial [Musa troglodytarum]